MTWCRRCCISSARTMSPAIRSSSTVAGMSEPKTIVIVGGGCYGSFYLRQLTRARSAGALNWERVIVVDRDPHCAVTRTLADAELVVAEWTEYFRDHMTDADAIV